MYQLFSDLYGYSLVNRPKRNVKTSISYGVRVYLINVPKKNAKTSISCGVRVYLINVNEEQVQMRMNFEDFGNVDLQRMFLHSEAILTRFELLYFVCDLFGLRRCRSSYQTLKCLSWYFGQKSTRHDGQVFWASNSHYT